MDSIKYIAKVMLPVVVTTAIITGVFGSRDASAESLLRLESVTPFTEVGRKTKLARGCDENTDYVSAGVSLEFRNDSVDARFNKRLSMLVEPFVSKGLGGAINSEIGCDLAAKYVLFSRMNEDEKGVEFYGRMGAGVVYADHDLRKQSTKWNFLPRGGVGAKFNIADWEVGVEIGIKHGSNSRIKHPNNGWNDEYVRFKVGKNFDNIADLNPLQIFRRRDRK